MTALFLAALASAAVQAGAAPQALYTTPGFESFSPRQTFRCVGPFGIFGNGTVAQDRDFVGLLSFTLRKDAPQNTLVWANFTDGKDFVLGQADFPGSVQEKHFEFIDWTTARLEFTTNVSGAPYRNQVYFSRCIPAALYVTASTEWRWRAKDLHADWASYRDSAGHLRVVPANTTVKGLGSPWVLLWPDKDPVEPLLIRFEHRPAEIKLDGGLDAVYTWPSGASHSAGSIAVMPLYGVRRVHGSGWLPKAQADADFWSRVLAAYPVGVSESYKVDDKDRCVRITDTISYRLMHDDWGIKPLRLAPVSPVVGVAYDSGYPVKPETAAIKKSAVATLLGPWAYAVASHFSYTIPIPSSRDDALAPTEVIGDPARIRAEQALDRLVASQTIKPDDTSDGGLNLQLKEYAQAYPFLSRATKSHLTPQLAAAFDASYSPENLQTVTDPVTGRCYVMCNKIWCAREAYDREWYAGRQLDAAYEYSTWVDSTAAARHWKAIQGLYAYFRIYDDWAWSGTLSSIFAYALCGDGMNFAMEGMLGVARMAKRQGDADLWADASYRAAKQALCTYASWYLSDWEKQIDYVTWTDTSYDYANKKGRYEIRRMAPKDVQTGFGLDIYSDTTGIKVFRNGSFWHASAAVYWNNPSLDRLYLEYLYPKLYRWEFKTLPALHPHWTDSHAIERFTNQPYGSNMVNTHVAARAVLFGQAPSELASLMTSLQPNIAPLYLVRSAEDLVESGTPQLWLPTDIARVPYAVWDARSRLLEVHLDRTSPGAMTVDWRWPGTHGVSPTPDAGPKPQSVSVNGKTVPIQQIAGGFWRMTLNGGTSLIVRIRYG